MKITEKQLRQIIREEIAKSSSGNGQAVTEGPSSAMARARTRRRRSPHRASPAALSAARSAVAKVKRRRPGASVSINSVDGWITVAGRKVVSLSPMGSRPLTPDDMVEDIVLAIDRYDEADYGVVHEEGTLREARERIALLDDDEVAQEVDEIMDRIERDPDLWHSSKVPGLLRAMERYLAGPTNSEFQRKLLKMLRKEQDHQAAMWRSDMIR